MDRRHRCKLKNQLIQPLSTKYCRKLPDLKALEDFTDVLVAQAGAGRQPFCQAWMDKLEANSVQMAVTGASTIDSSPSC